IATSQPFADSGLLLAMTGRRRPCVGHAFFTPITGSAGVPLAMTADGARTDTDEHGRGKVTPPAIRSTPT
ncbi:MAG TPA: hypothetical protein PLZ55_05400, partial [bacterium]|nr:hypothetical protein [bacterium]